MAPKNILVGKYFPGGGWPRQLQMTVVWGETRYSGGPGGRPRRAAAQSGRAVSLTLTLAKTRQTKPSFSWTLHRTATRQPPPGPLTTRKEEATRGGVGGSVLAPHWNPKTVGLPPLSHPRHTRHRLRPLAHQARIFSKPFLTTVTFKTN